MDTPTQDLTTDELHETVMDTLTLTTTTADIDNNNNEDILSINYINKLQHERISIETQQEMNPIMEGFRTAAGQHQSQSQLQQDVYTHRTRGRRRTSRKTDNKEATGNSNYGRKEKKKIA